MTDLTTEALAFALETAATAGALIQDFRDNHTFDVKAPLINSRLSLLES